MSVKSLITPAQLKADVAFSDTDLSSAMMRQASLFAHYGVIAAAAQRQMTQADNQVEVTRALVANEVRKSLAEAGEKATEAKIAAEVTMDSRVIECEKDLVDAQFVYELARQSVEAFKHRRDMLVQVAKIQLEERQGQVRMSGDSMPTVGMTLSESLNRLTGKHVETA